MFTESQRRDIARTQAQPPAVPRTRIGLSDVEIRSYSLARAIAAQIPGHEGAMTPWERGMSLERAASEAVAQALGRDPRAVVGSFLVPEEVQTRGSDFSRADVVGTTTAGGYLVETSNVSFIDRLRNRTVAYRLGATRLPGLVGNANVPKLVTDANSYWMNETTSITESEQVFGQLSLTPHMVGGYTEISRMLLLQSIPAADIIVAYDLSAILGIAVDAGVISGSGAAGQPHGIIGLTGVSTASGATLTQTMLRQLQTNTATANSDGSTFGYVMAPATAQILATRQRFSGSSTALWDDGTTFGGGLVGSEFDGVVEGARAMSSNQIPAATILAGPWSEIVIAEWGVLEVEVNPYANFQQGIVGIRALWTIDVGVRRPATFSVLTSVS